MMAMAAARLGFRTIILEPDEYCPAEQVASSHITAAYDDTEALETLAALCDVITYEFENVPIEAARLLAEKKPVFPPPRALEVAQDRLVEKTFLNDCGIATAEFVAVDSPGAAGRGRSPPSTAVVFLRLVASAMTVRASESSGERRTTRRALSGRSATFRSFWKALCPLPAKSRWIAARSQDGAIIAYDPARNEHREGILRTSTLPCGAAESTLRQAREAAEAVLTKLDYVGIVGIEFFVLVDGTLLANELAPRVHNSGHWTEAVCTVSQFEQHIRAVAGLPLGSAMRHFDCRMENLIGDDVDQVDAILAESECCPASLWQTAGPTRSQDGARHQAG